jgi:RNase adaptor protein for sRNA GlmZ degradation
MERSRLKEAKDRATNIIDTSKLSTRGPERS